MDDNEAVKAFKAQYDAATPEDKVNMTLTALSETQLLTMRGMVQEMKRVDRIITRQLLLFFMTCLGFVAVWFK